MAKRREIDRPKLLAKVELAYESLLDNHFGHILPQSDDAPPRAVPADDAPPPNVLDQLKLLNSITAFIELKHKLQPEEEDAPLDGMVGVLRTATKRSARDAAAKNDVGTSALLHRADEHTGDDDGEPGAA